MSKQIKNQKQPVGQGQMSKSKKQKGMVTAPKLITELSAAPVNTAYKFVNKPPRYLGTRHGIRLVHNEYIRDLSSSNTTNAFKCESWTVNPAYSTLFPWLSSQATSYAEFKFHSLSFHVGTQAATSSTGMFGMCMSPDCTDTAPTSKSEFLSNENAVRSNVWKGVTFHVPKEILNRLPKYLTSIHSSHSVDTTHSLGNLYVCSNGINSSSLYYGELYVTYDVELMMPQPSSTEVVSITTTPSNGQPFESASVSGNATISVAFSSPVGVAATNVMRVDAGGNFIVIAYLSGTGGTLVNPAFSAVDENSLAAPIATTTLCSFVDSTGTQGVVWLGVRNAPNPWFLLGVGGVFWTTKSMYMTIVKDQNFSNEYDIPALMRGASVQTQADVEDEDDLSGDGHLVAMPGRKSGRSFTSVPVAQHAVLFQRVNQK